MSTQNMFSSRNKKTTLQPPYNTVLDITRFKGGSQKYIDYIEK